MSLNSGPRGIVVGNVCQITVVKEYEHAVMGKVLKCGHKPYRNVSLYVSCYGYRCPDIYTGQKVVVKEVVSFGRFSGKADLFEQDTEKLPVYYQILKEGNSFKLSYYRWLSKYLPEENSFLTASVLFGEVGRQQEVATIMKDLGILHIMAISGVNIIYLQALLRVLIRLLIRELREIIELLLLVFLYVIVGETVSIIRAIFMVLLHLLLRRSGGSRGCQYFFLGLSFLLLLDQSYIGDAGYWLVCGACFGVYIAAPFVRGYLVKNALIVEFCNSILIWLCVAPVQWLIFGELQPIGVLVGVILAPLVETLTIFGYLSTIVRFSPIFARGIITILGMLSSGILLVIHLFHALVS